MKNIPEEKSILRIYKGYDSPRAWKEKSLTAIADIE
tara:strand:+ start:57 stop:164 length:108 start_codon:yes stop_codon:yes gene_type:complete